MTGPALERDLLAHLAAQIESARRLLAAVLAQGAAIRAHDPDAVLARLAEIQTEMGRRGHLENERTQLLMRAGAALGLPPAQVTLEQLVTLVTPEGGRAALERSAELRGLLAEIAREHGINRALMRQELSFLSHLVRMVGGEPEPGYRPGAGAPQAAPTRYRALDLQA